MTCLRVLNLQIYPSISLRIKPRLLQTQLTTILNLSLTRPTEPHLQHLDICLYSIL